MPSPELNRLRAAALIPIIVAGLADFKLSAKREALINEHLKRGCTMRKYIALLILTICAHLSHASCLEMAKGLATQLHPDTELAEGFEACKAWPDGGGKTIVLLPFFGIPPDETKQRPENEYFDVEILIINNDDQRVLSRYYEKGAWQGDVPRVSQTGIDTARYWLAPGVRAFGITVSKSVSSRYIEGRVLSIRLFTASGDAIKPVMDRYLPIDFYQRSIFDDCDQGEVHMNRTLAIGSTANHSYSDIVVIESKTIEKMRLVKNKCKESSKPERYRDTLRFDGNVYSVPDRLVSDYQLNPLLPL